MPNWCSNNLTIKHPDPAIIAKISEAFHDGKLLQTVVPMPENPKVPEGGMLSSMPDWYQWCVANWGTKWDISDGSLIEVSPTEINLAFDTAWAPPVEAYRTMEENGFVVDASYHEFSMCFYGAYAGGVDSYCEYTEFNQIPDWVVDQFCLADRIAECIADSEEDDDE